MVPGGSFPLPRPKNISLNTSPLPRGCRGASQTSFSDSCPTVSGQQTNLVGAGFQVLPTYPASFDMAGICGTSWLWGPAPVPPERKLQALAAAGGPT